MKPTQVALYARVSSEQQNEARTIESQIADIYLNKLDKYIEQILIPEYTKGTKRQANSEDESLMHKAMWLRKKGRKEEANALRKAG